MKWWGQMPWSSFSECWALKDKFFTLFFHIKRPFSSSSLSAIRVVSSAYLRLFIFLPAGKVVWYSYLFKNFSQFVVIHTVKDFDVVIMQKYMFFWNSLAFYMIQQMLAFWSLVPLPFVNPAWTSGSFRSMYCWSLAWRILSITLLSCEMSAILW